MYIVFSGICPDIKIIKTFTNESDAMDFVRPHSELGLAKDESVELFLKYGCQP